MKVAAAAVATTVALLALHTAAVAQAGAIWRCGGDGAVHYSQTPCTEGRALEAERARPADDLRAARGVATRDRQMALALARERREREAAAPGYAGFGATPVRLQPKSAPKPQGPKKPPRPFEAIGTSPSAAPASPRTAG